MGSQRVRHDWATFTNPFIMKIEYIEHRHACLHTLCCCSVAQSFPTLCDPMDCSPPGFLALHHLPELAQTNVHWVGDAIQPSHPLLLLPSVFPCIRVFSKELALRISWPKCWSFSFRISASNEYSILISFRIEWCDFLAVQGSLKRLFQHHNSKRTILQWLVLFMVKISHLYMKVTQSCLTLCDPVDYTVLGSLQDRILEWVVGPFSRGASQLRDQTQVSHIAEGFLTSWATREALYMTIYLYMTTLKTIALTIQTFVSKVISLFFNMLSRFVIAFLPKSKCFIISWLKSLSEIILEPRKVKSFTVSTFSHLCIMKGWDQMP